MNSSQRSLDPYKPSVDSSDDEISQREEGATSRDLLFSPAMVTAPFALAAVLFGLQPAQSDFTAPLGADVCETLLLLSIGGMILIPVCAAVVPIFLIIRWRNRLRYVTAASFVLFALLGFFCCVWLGTACGGALSG